jgi:hypothetical protein
MDKHAVMLKNQAQLAQLNSMVSQNKRREPELLPHDSTAAAAQVLARLRSGAALHTTKDDLVALTERNRAILDTDNDTILESLASQLQILEAIFQRYILATEHMPRADMKASLMKIAINAQQAYLRTAALLAAAKAKPVN